MNSRGMNTVLRLVGIGWYVGLCIGGGAFGGLWLDRQFDLSPIFTLLGLGAGIIIALVGMIRMLMAVLSATAESDNTRNN